jgi:hypothetical protein
MPVFGEGPCFFCDDITSSGDCIDPVAGAVARKADHGLPNLRTAIFAATTFSTAAGWEPLALGTNYPFTARY